MSRTGRHTGREAQRYARAFYALMKKKGLAEAVDRELARILDFAGTHLEFGRLLLAPTVSLEEKEGLIDHLVPSGDLRNLVKLLVRKKRFVYFEKVVQAYHDLFNEDQGVEEATVVTAFPVADDLRQKLEKVLGEKLKKKVILTAQTDPDLIGGAVVYTRSRVVDGSLREKLKELRQTLLGVGDYHAAT
ncbi:MAG: ATP synthase F1 subunit delta [Candidatus Omnitrophica bacterium]|nr:ATP synthase F1 subunit delta [Candidatus Omnitrophota bacterium]